MVEAAHARLRHLRDKFPQNTFPQNFRLHKKNKKNFF
jgi:hypothetical protein